MTWSIVACDPNTGSLGVVVTTKFFAVGALCPFVCGGIGALSTQAFVNVTFGPRGLRLLAEGVPAQQTVEALVASDDGREHRQIHVIDGAGNNAAYTGSACNDWAGHRLGDGFSVAGNLLAGPQVVDASFASYADGTAKPFAERLIDAMDAGQAQGGDKRGRQSAALTICTTEEYPWLSLRVDDHPDPLVELRRLYAEAHNDLLPFMEVLPTRANPAGITDMAMVEEILERQKSNMTDRGSTT
jgi:uncharacterized Ntn-hydrolase superfamily protein